MSNGASSENTDPVGELETERRSAERMERRRLYGETLAKWAVTRPDIDAMPSREREAAEQAVIDEVEAKLAAKEGA